MSGVRPVKVTELAVEEATLGPVLPTNKLGPPAELLSPYVYAPAPEPVSHVTVKPVLVKPVIGDAGKVGAAGEVPALVKVSEAVDKVREGFTNR